MDYSTMKGAARRADDVASFLGRHSGLITRRWLRAVRQHMGIRPASREGFVGLVNQLPRLFAELRGAIAQGSAGPLDVRAQLEAQTHALERWRQGFALDELYLELDLLERCIQTSVREYFATAENREGQVCTHEVVESFFSTAIRSAMREYQQEADLRVVDALAERDAADLARRASEERLRLAAKAAGLGIFEWDPANGEAVWENARMFEITGQAAEAGPLSAKQFAELVVDEDESAALRRALATGNVAESPFHATFRIRRRGSSAPTTVEIFACFMPGRGGRPRLVGTMADVTRRIEGEDALKQADRRKDIFLATLAHELRNPLVPIINAAHLLKKGDLPPSQLRWIQGVIERHARHLASLVDDLLDLSRISAGKVRLLKEVLDIRTIIERAIEINAPAAAARRHRLDAPRLDRTAATLVYGDPTRLTQIVSNLVDNAIKYTPEGGHIQLRLSVRNEAVILEVEDNGIGMEPDSIQTMFRLFEQEGAAGAAKIGLGIGLSVTRALAAMHGGSVRATSEGRGKGSCFVVELPICDEPAGETRTPLRTGEPGARLRVLVVDDNYDAAESLAAVVGQYHQVRTAGSGEDAQRLARDFVPDAAIVDLALPGMSGYSLARYLLNSRESESRLFLIALTGHGQPEDIERSREVGFDHHLIKPARPEEILTLLAKAGRRR